MTPLHLTNGDAMLPGLRGAGVEGEIVPWRDALHEGPVTGRRMEFRGVSFAARDAALARHTGEIVLWFEADLYDQLQLIDILARLEDPGRITLRSVGEHPSRARFGGLGELTGAQLRELPAVPVTAEALALARRAWDAFTAPEPTGLAEIAATRSVELRFLGEAFDRLGREYPSTRDGLSLTERRILAAAPGRPGEIFLRSSARETRPFLGDTFCFERIERLAPLLRRAGDVVELTDAGRATLAGERDHVAEDGIDRWIGGVHLQGRSVAWRWDEGTEAVVRMGA
jgi:hypothetical protein